MVLTTNAERLRDLRQQAEAAVEAADRQVERIAASLSELEYAVAEMKRSHRNALRTREDTEAVAAELQERIA